MLRGRSATRLGCALRVVLLLACAAPACDAHAPAQPAPVAAPRAAVTPTEPVAPAPAATRSAAEAPSYPPPPPPDPPIRLTPGGKHAVRGEKGAVTAVEKTATRIGADVLRSGGNAVDAAVAVAYALAVTHPSAGNIGGGGFMMVRLASGEIHAVDFRETAPAGVTTEKILAMLKDDGAIGYRSAGVPGTVAGMSLALERFGTRPLAELIAPAIALAKKGHRLGPRQALTLRWAWPKLQQDPAARAIWSKNGKQPLAEGDRVRQLDLARSLELIAKDGSNAFYEGPIAKKIDEAMRKHGGYVTAKDLEAYRAKLRTPLEFSYRGFRVATMPPPSMGGIALAEIMLTLERLGAHDAPQESGLALHLFVEASKRAYSERRLVGGDPDFLKPDIHAAALARLLDGTYLATRKPPIDPEHATPASELQPPRIEIAAESPETTHFSVVDAAGNAVACTTTQSAGFGSKVVIPGTGILLGNALGGFSETGVNTVAAGKRMASSMTPTIVTQNGKLALVLGSPGGDTIPNTVAQVLRNVVDWRMPIGEAVRAGRIHHQWMPDKIRVEKLNPPPKAALDDLVRRGHTIDLDPMPIGDANDILVEVDTGVAWAAADGREGGIAIGVNEILAPNRPAAPDTEGSKRKEAKAR